jgi:hypothetical protein
VLCPALLDGFHSGHRKGACLSLGVDAVTFGISVKHRPTPPGGEHRIQFRALFRSQDLGEKLGASAAVESVGDAPDGARHPKRLGMRQLSRHDIYLTGQPSPITPDPLGQELVGSQPANIGLVGICCFEHGPDPAAVVADCENPSSETSFDFS